MGVYKIKIRQRDRVCFSKERNSQNVFYTFDYIPGSSLWGFFLGRYAREKDANLTDMFNGNIRFLNSYIKMSDKDEVGYISIPMPLSVMTCKKQPFSHDFTGLIGHDVEDLLYTEATECGFENDKYKCGAPLKKVTGNYLSNKLNNRGLIFQYSPKKSIEMHNRISKKTQSTDRDSLFSYELLDEINSIYQGYILTENVDNEHRIIEFIKGFNNKNIFLGKAKTSGYGVFEFSISEEDDYFKDEKELFFSKKNNLKEFGTISLYLFSDAIIMDDMNRYQSIIKPSFLGLDRELELVKSFSETTKIQGYNAKHNREKIVDLAIKKGSSFLYKVKEGYNIEKIKERLEEIEREGLGMRRPEGYGIVLFQRKRIYKDKLEDYNG